MYPYWPGPPRRPPITPAGISIHDARTVGFSGATTPWYWRSSEEKSCRECWNLDRSSDRYRQGRHKHISAHRRRTSLSVIPNSRPNTTATANACSMHNGIRADSRHRDHMVARRSLPARHWLQFLEPVSQSATTRLERPTRGVFADFRRIQARVLDTPRH